MGLDLAGVGDVGIIKTSSDPSTPEPAAFGFCPGGRSIFYRFPEKLPVGLHLPARIKGCSKTPFS
jgi:hypothetical protein